MTTDASEDMNDQMNILIREGRDRRRGARQWQLGEEDRKEMNDQIRRARAEGTETVDLREVRSNG